MSAPKEHCRNKNISKSALQLYDPLQIPLKSEIFVDRAKDFIGAKYDL